MYYVGFDIGGTKCAVVLGKLKENQVKILAREEMPTSLPIETLEQLAKHVEMFQQERMLCLQGLVAAAL